MKSLRYLSVTLLPALLIACTVEEERGDDAQFKVENPVVPRSASVKKDVADKPSDVDDAFSDVERTSQSDDSEQEMSDFEKKQLEMQEKNLELQKAQAEAAERRHQSILKLEEEGQKSNRLTSFAMLSLMGQMLDSINGTVRPEFGEDCEEGAAGTSNTKQFQQIMDALGAQVTRDLGGELPQADNASSELSGAVVKQSTSNAGQTDNAPAGATSASTEGAPADSSANNAESTSATQELMGPPTRESIGLGGTILNDAPVADSGIMGPFENYEERGPVPFDNSLPTGWHAPMALPTSAAAPAENDSNS